MMSPEALSTPDHKIRQFSPEFRFGSAVAPYQVEGNLSGERRSDWDDFIKNHPERNVFSPEELGPNWWKRGVAEEDFARMKDLGLSVQRLGFEWARIIPEKGKVDPQALHRYREMIDCLHALGMMPIVTLNHFVLPQWVATEGGWESSSTKRAFAYYTELIADCFGDVPYWITVNEPMNTLAIGYLDGSWPPGKKSLPSALRAASGLLGAHELAYERVKKTIPDAQVGVANALLWARPHDPNAVADRALTGVANALYNGLFLAKSSQTSDFIGINYYTGYSLKFIPHLRGIVAGIVTNENHQGTAMGITDIPFGTIVSPDAPVSDVGWPIVPDFFLEALEFLHNKFHKPIIITENGIADKDDQYRSFYLLTHLITLHEAQRRGVNIPIYIHWSSIDNQEWMDGFRLRFGLVGLDPKTGERTIRQSAELYREIASSGVIDVAKLSQTYLTPKQQEQMASFITALDKRKHS